MQRMMAVTVCALALVLGIGFFCGINSSRTSEEMRNRAGEIEALLDAGDWSAALGMTREMLDDWEKRSGILAMWVNHEDVDAVNIQLLQLVVALEEGEHFFARQDLVQLQEALEHIYHRDAFQLKNIL